MNSKYCYLSELDEEEINLYNEMISTLFIDIPFYITRHGVQIHINDKKINVGWYHSLFLILEKLCDQTTDVIGRKFSHNIVFGRPKYDYLCLTFLNGKEHPVKEVYKLYKKYINT